jgi:hypothetical protein
MTIGRGTAWSGWIIFASIMMTVIGLINLFEGCVALFTDERVVATPDKLVVVDLTSWGWTLVLFGVVLLGIGISLLRGAGWARIAAIVVIGLHAVTQVLWLGAYPIWSLLMIALDTVLLFALCARWGEIRPDLYARDSRELSADGVRGDALYGQPPQ